MTYQTAKTAADVHALQRADNAAIEAMIAPEMRAKSAAFHNRTHEINVKIICDRLKITYTPESAS